MPKLRFVDYYCPTCRTRPLLDLMVDYDDLPTYECCDCGAILQIAISAPTVLTASDPDGTNRLPLEKEWSKLNVEKVNQDWDSPERKRLSKEQAKIRSGAYRRLPKA